MKSQLAAVTVALARLAADGFRPRGDVMLLAVADEEVGDEKVGMPWLVEERADLAPDFVVGEGRASVCRLRPARSTCSTTASRPARQRR